MSTRGIASFSEQQTDRLANVRETSSGGKTLRLTGSAKLKVADARRRSNGDVADEGNMTRMNQVVGSPSAGMEAPRGAMGAKISPNSFSAGRPEWAGRVAPNTNAPGSSQVGSSLRDMFKPGSGSTNGLSLLKSGSLFDNPRFARNRDYEKGTGEFAPKTAESAAGVKKTSLADKLQSNPESVSDDYSAGNYSYKDPDTGSIISREEYEKKTSLASAAAYGGDVEDPREFMSMALRDGLGDEKLIQAAMKGGDTDLSKRYKNLSRMGVV